jgi:hypothetical protein
MSYSLINNILIHKKGFPTPDQRPDQVFLAKEALKNRFNSFKFNLKHTNASSLSERDLKNTYNFYANSIKPEWF